MIVNDSACVACVAVTRLTRLKTVNLYRLRPYTLPFPNMEMDDMTWPRVHKTMNSSTHQELNSLKPCAFRTGALHFGPGWDVWEDTRTDPGEMNIHRKSERYRSEPAQVMVKGPMKCVQEADSDYPEVRSFGASSELGWFLLIVCSFLFCCFVPCEGLRTNKMQRS